MTAFAIEKALDVEMVAKTIPYPTVAKSKTSIRLRLQDDRAEDGLPAVHVDVMRQTRQSRYRYRDPYRCRLSRGCRGLQRARAISTTSCQPASQQLQASNQFRPPKQRSQACSSWLAYLC